MVIGVMESTLYKITDLLIITYSRFVFFTCSSKLSEILELTICI